MRSIQSVLLAAVAGLLLAGQGVVATASCSTGSLAELGPGKLSCTSLGTAVDGSDPAGSCTSGWVPSTSAEVEAVASAHSSSSLHLGKWVAADKEFVTHDGQPMSQELVSALLMVFGDTTMQGIVEDSADTCFSGTHDGTDLTLASDDCAPTHIPVCNEDVTCDPAAHAYNEAIKECHLPLLFTKADGETFVGADKSAAAYGNFDVTGSDSVYVDSTTLLDLHVGANLNSADLSSGLDVTHDAGTCTLSSETFSITHIPAADGIGEHILVTADSTLPCTAGQTLTFDLTIGGEAFDFSVEFVALVDDFGIDGYPFNEAIASFSVRGSGDPAALATMSRTLDILGSAADAIDGNSIDLFSIASGPFVPSITSTTVGFGSTNVGALNGGSEIGNFFKVFLLPQARMSEDNAPFGFEFETEGATDPVPELDSGDRVVLVGQLMAKDLDELVVSNGPWSITSAANVIVGTITGRVYLVGPVNFETTPEVSVTESLLNGVAVDSSDFTITIENVEEPTIVAYTLLDGSVVTPPLSLNEKTEHTLTFEITDGDIVAGDGTTVPDLEWAGPASQLLGLTTIEDGADMTVELGKATYTLTIADTDLVARAVFDKHVEGLSDDPPICAGPWPLDLSFESGDSGVQSVTLVISNLGTGDEPSFGTPPTPSAVVDGSITAESFTIDVAGPDLFPGCTPSFAVAATVPSDTQTVTATPATIVDVDGSTGKSTVALEVPGVPTMRALFDADSASYDATDGSLDWDFSLTLDTDVDTATVTVPVNTRADALTITGDDVDIDENAEGTATFTVVGASIMPGVAYYGTFSLSGPHFTPNTWTTTKSDGSSNSATQGELTVTVDIPADTLDYPTLYDADGGVTYPGRAPLTLTLTSDLDSETGTLDLNVDDVDEDATSVSVTVDTSTIIDGDSTGTILSITVNDPDVLDDVPDTHPECSVKLASGSALPASVSSVLSEENGDDSGNGVFTADFELDGEFDFEAYAAEASLQYTSSADESQEISVIVECDNAQSSPATLMLENVQELPQAADITFGTVQDTPENAGAAANLVTITIATDEFAYDFVSVLQFSNRNGANYFTAPSGFGATTTESVQTVTSRDGSPTSISQPDDLTLAVPATSWSRNVGDISATATLGDFDLEAVMENARVGFNTYAAAGMSTFNLRLVVLSEDGASVTVSDNNFTPELINEKEYDLCDAVAGTSSDTIDEEDSNIGQFIDEATAITVELSCADVEGGDMLDNELSVSDVADASVVSSVLTTESLASAYNHGFFIAPASSSYNAGNFEFEITSTFHSSGFNFEDIAREQVATIGTWTPATSLDVEFVAAVSIGDYHTVIESLTLTITDVDEIILQDFESGSFKCAEHDDGSPVTATPLESDSFAFKVVDEDYVVENDLTDVSKFYSFTPVVDATTGAHIAPLLSVAIAGSTMTARGTEVTYNVECSAFNLERVADLASELSLPASTSKTTSFDLHLDIQGASQTESRTFDFYLEDRNDDPLGVGLLRFRSFVVPENAAAGTVIARLDTADEDRPSREDPITKVRVFSLGAQVEPYEIAPGVWGIRVAEGANFNFEDRQDSLQGDRSDMETSAVFNLRTDTDDKEIFNPAPPPGGPMPRRRRGRRVQAGHFQPNKEVSEDETFYTVPLERACEAIPDLDDVLSTKVEEPSVYDFSSHPEHLDLPGDSEPLLRVDGVAYRSTPLCIVMYDCGGPERTTLETCDPEDPNMVVSARAFSTILYVQDQNDAPELKDVNLVPDAEPEFTNNFTLVENTPRDTPFGTLEFFDEDAGDYVASVTVLGDQAAEFEVIFSGTQWRIHNKKAFDFEAPEANSAGSNSILVNIRITDFQATGPPASRVVPITVNIADANEVRHTVTGVDLEISETADGSGAGSASSMGTVTLGKAHHLGRNIASATVISTSLSGLEASDLSVDVDNADASDKVITVTYEGTSDNAIFDHEAGNGQFTVDLRVVDSGTPALTSVFTVPVDITDVNEKPVLTEVSSGPYKFEIGLPVRATGFIVEFSDVDADATLPLAADFTVTSSADSDDGPPAFFMRAVEGSSTQFELVASSEATFTDGTTYSVTSLVVNNNLDSDALTNIDIFAELKTYHPELAEGADTTVSFTELSTATAVIAMVDNDVGVFDAADYTIVVDGGGATYLGLTFTLTHDSGTDLDLVITPVAAVDIDATGTLSESQTVSVTVTQTGSGFENSPATFDVIINVTPVNEVATAATVADAAPTLLEDMKDPVTGIYTAQTVTTITVTDPEDRVSPTDGVTATVADATYLQVMYESGAWVIKTEGVDLASLGDSPAPLDCTVTFSGTGEAGHDSDVSTQACALTVTNREEVPTVKASYLPSSPKMADVREESVSKVVFTLTDDDLNDGDNADFLPAHHRITAAVLGGESPLGGPHADQSFFVVDLNMDSTPHTVTISTNDANGPLLNYEDEMPHTFDLVVTTSDGNVASEKDVTISFRVDVTDLQKAPFMLVGPGGAVVNSATLSVNENSPINSVVGPLYFADDDNDVVESVEIIGPAANLFTITPDLNGADNFVVLTLTKFDAEDDQPNEYTFAARIKELKPAGTFAQSRTVTITITIANVPEAPVFTVPHEIRWTEFAALDAVDGMRGTWAQITEPDIVLDPIPLGVVQITDVDTAASGITLSTSDAAFDFDGHELRLIDTPTNGLSQADFERVGGPATIMVAVSATDGDKIIPQTISVKIIDGNDEPAIVGSGTTAEISEHSNADTAIAVPGTSTPAVIAFFDQDGDVANIADSLTLTVQPAHFQDLFTLAPGFVTAEPDNYVAIVYNPSGSKSLDFEDAMMPVSGELTMTVTGMDVWSGDAEDMFEPVEHTFTVSVLNVNEAPVAVDSDFTVQESTAETTDMTFDVVIADIDEADVLSVASLTVTGSPVGTVMLTHSESFAAGAKGRPGLLTVTVTVQEGDFETDPTFTADLVVSGDSDGDATFPLTVTLTDFNEVPVVTLTGTGSSGHLEVEENSVNVMGQVSIDDPEGAVSSTDVHLVGTSWFEISFDSVSGTESLWNVELVVDPLNFEADATNSNLDFNIIVNDGTGRSFPGEVVLVDVLEPMSVDTSIIHLREGSATTTASVVITDPDLESLSIAAAAGSGNIGDGIVLTTEADAPGTITAVFTGGEGLDHEGSPQVTYELIVTKAGADTTFAITVMVDDYNEAPVTGPLPAFTLDENSPPGTAMPEMFTVNNPEGDLPASAITTDNARWGVQATSSPNAYKLVQLGAPFDYEADQASPDLTFHIIIDDSADTLAGLDDPVAEGALRVVEVSVLLADVPEEPVFAPTTTTSFTLPESNLGGGKLGPAAAFLYVADPDDVPGINLDSMTLTLIGSTPAADNVHALFGITKGVDGQWSLENKELTLDLLAGMAPSYTLHFTAVDFAGDTNTHLSVTVTMGSMAPFLVSTPVLSVNENVPLVSRVAFLSLVDVDGGVVTGVSVLGEGASTFRVSNSGNRWIMTTLAPLDAETKDTYSFPIVIADNSVPPSERAVDMVVHIVDRNEYPSRPGTLPGAPVSFAFAEGVAAGEWLGMLPTFDVDRNETGLLRITAQTPNTFSDSGDDWTLVRRETGWALSNAFDADYEAGQDAESTITIELADEREPTVVTATFTVKVQVLNVNEGGMLTTGTTFSVAEDVGYQQELDVGRTVGTIAWSDDDDFTGHTAQYTAAIQGDAPFTLVSTGPKAWDIDTAAGIDFEAVSSYTFDVVVADADPLVLPNAAEGQMGKTWTTTYTIAVSDVAEPTVTATPSVTATASSSASPSVTAAVTPSRTAVPTPSSTSAVTPSATPTRTAVPSRSPGAVPTASVSPSAAATPSTTPVPGVVQRFGRGLTQLGAVVPLGSETGSTPPTLLFSASSISTGNELYRQDFPAAVSLAAELADGTLSSSPSQLRRVPAQDAVCFVAASTQHGKEVFCYTNADRVWLASDIASGAAGSNPKILAVAGSALIVSATVQGSSRSAVYRVSVDATAPNTWSKVGDLHNARLYTKTASGAYFVATGADDKEHVYTGMGAVVTAIDTTSATAIVIESMAAAKDSLILSGSDAAGIVSVRLFTPDATGPTTGTVITLGLARRALSGRALQSVRSPRFMTSLGDDVYFAWRSESDPSKDALWRVQATGEATEVAMIPKPASAPTTATVRAASIIAAGGSIFVESSGTSGDATVTDIFKWVDGAWFALGSRDVSAGRDVGSNPGTLTSISDNAFSYSATASGESSPDTFIFDAARSATASAVLPSVSPTPSGSPVPAAQASQPEPEAEDNSGALGAGIAIIAVLVVAIGAFMVYRAGVCSKRKEPEAVPATPVNQGAAAPAAPAAATTEPAQA